MQPKYPHGPYQYNTYTQGPYNGYGYGGYQNPHYNLHNPNNQGNLGNNMGGSLNRSKGGQWGKMQWITCYLSWLFNFSNTNSISVKEQNWMVLAFVQIK